jgi:hypothetical protein
MPAGRLQKGRVSAFVDPSEYFREVPDRLMVVHAEREKVPPVFQRYGLRRVDAGS